MAVVASPGPTMMRDVDTEAGGVTVAAGVPAALVLFSMGGISATVGLACPGWSGQFRSFSALPNPSSMPRSRACIPPKTGGAAVHGATAWIRYSRILAPLSLWANWLAWTPVLAIGAGLGAGYLLSIFLELPSRPIAVAVDPARPRLHFRSASRSGSTPPSCWVRRIMLAVFAIQHRPGNPAAPRRSRPC